MQLLHVLDDVLATRGSEDGMELCLKQASSSSPPKKSAGAAASNNGEDYDRPEKDQEQIFSFHRDVVCKDSDKGMELVFLEPPPPPTPNNGSAVPSQKEEKYTPPLTSSSKNNENEENENHGHHIIEGASLSSSSNTGIQPTFLERISPFRRHDAVVVKSPLSPTPESTVVLPKKMGDAILVDKDKQPPACTPASNKKVDHDNQEEGTPVVVEVDPFHLLSTLPSKCSRGQNIADNMNAKQSMHSLTITAAKPPKTLGFMAKKKVQNQALSTTDKSIANKNTMRRSWPRLGRGRKYATTKTLVQKPLRRHHHAVDDDLLDVRDDHESSRVVKENTAPTSTTLLLQSLSKDVSMLKVMLYQLQQQNKRREQASSDTDSTASESSSCADDDRNFIIIDPEEENEMRDDGCSIAGFLELLAGDDDEANKFFACYQENAKRLFSI